MKMVTTRRPRESVLNALAREGVVSDAIDLTED